MYPRPCIHRCGCGGLCDSGHPCPMADNAPPLCPKCQAEFNEDPIARSKALQQEMAESAEERAEHFRAWDDIPF